MQKPSSENTTSGSALKAEAPEPERQKQDQVTLPDAPFKCAGRKQKKHEFHGMHGTSEYHSWHDAKMRCENPNSRSFKYYGARGITVCDRWQSFVNFIADMGLRPTSQHQLDRIDNNGNYEPGNCKWATRKEQQNNKRTNRFVVWNGERKTISEWAELFGLDKGTLRYRMNQNWPLCDVFTFPVTRNNSKQSAQFKCSSGVSTF